MNISVSNILRKIALVALLAIAGVATAQNTSDKMGRLIVTLNNGTNVFFRIGARPVVSTLDNLLTVKHAFVSYQVPRDQVKKIHLISEEDCNKFMTSIDVVQHDKRIVFSQEGSNLIIEGCPAATMVSVFDTSGRLIATANADTEGVCVINTESFPSAIAIVKAGTNVIKLMINN